METPSTILCLDLAMSTGWTALTPEGRTMSGHIDLNGGKSNGYGMRFVRLKCHHHPWAEHHAIPYAGVPVGIWKRTLTGNGNASKETVTAAVRDLGFVPESQDEADALGISIT